MRRLRRVNTPSAESKKKTTTPRADTPRALTNSASSNNSNSSSVVNVRRVFRRRSSAPLTSPSRGSTKNSNNRRPPRKIVIAEDVASMASTVPCCEDDEESLMNEKSTNRSSGGGSFLFDTDDTTTASSTVDEDDALVEVNKRTSSYRPSPAHLVDALTVWCQATYRLAHSQPTREVWAATQHVLGTATGLAVHTALLPVTIPWSVTCHTTNLLVGLSLDVLNGAGALLQLTQQQRLLADSSDRRTCQNNSTDDGTRHTNRDGSENESSSSHILSGPLDLVLGVWRLPGQVVGVASMVTGMIADEIGSAVTQLVAPTLGGQQEDSTHHHRNRANHNYEQPTTRRVTPPKKHPSSALSSCTASTVSSSSSSTREDEQGGDDFLDRLRLDFSDMETTTTHTTATTKKAPQRVTKSVAFTSRLLLRVDDLDLVLPTESSSDAIASPEQEQQQPLYCIDLTGKDPSYSKLFATALDRLAQQGLSLFANHPTTRLSKPMPDRYGIVWKPEGSTGKLLRKLAKLNTIQRLEALKTDTLIWSGKMSNSNCSSARHDQVPVFLSRGVVQMSPRAFLHLLWDNKRTSEYNNYCLGRHDILMLDGNNVLEKGASTGTKVIESETRIPVTGMSVLLSCLMHVRPLEGTGDQGYVIVSRSLDEGASGNHHHFPKSSKKSSSSEILWGVNVLRHVPNHPELTDLTSVSQVASSMVPKFVQARLGVMGIEDFYKNVRQIKTPVSPTRTASRPPSVLEQQPVVN